MKFKSIILIILLSIGTHNSFQAMHLFSQATQQKQQTLKTSTKLVDNRTFNQFEQDFQKKYNLTTPIFLQYCPGTEAHCAFPISQILKDKKENQEYVTMSNRYHAYKHRSQPIINVDKTMAQQVSPQELEWTLLHENGHAKNWENIRNVVTCMNISIPGIFYLWGRNKPYKNILTKGLSKTAAAVLIPMFCYGMYSRFYEEPQADNFANQKASKEVLQGEKRNFDVYKQACDITFQESNIPAQYWPTLEKAVSPIHPSFSSRIAKIEQTIQERFPNEV